jgi:hypothetical protein
MTLKIGSSDASREMIEYAQKNKSQSIFFEGDMTILRAVHFVYKKVT